jgi:hypothetical protein
MASLLAVAQRLGMTVVGEPEAFGRRESEAEAGTGLPVPALAARMAAPR